MIIFLSKIRREGILVRLIKKKKILQETRHLIENRRKHFLPDQKQGMLPAVTASAQFRTGGLASRQREEGHGDGRNPYPPGRDDGCIENTKEPIEKR